MLSGRLTEVKPDPANVLSPSAVRLLARSLKAVLAGMFAKKYLSIVEIPAPRLTEASEEQPENVLEPTVVMLSGRLTVTSEEQP